MDAHTPRAEVIQSIQNVVDSTSWIAAAWLGGSDATGRTDDLSDIDLQLIVDDDRIEEAFSVVESMLENTLGVSHVWRVEGDTRLGHPCAVYIPENAPSCMCLDVMVIPLSSGKWHTQRERHGKPVVLLDRNGVLEKPLALDQAHHKASMLSRIAYHQASHPIHKEVVGKAIARGNCVEASVLYQLKIMRPLIELMRIEDCPDRFDFEERYLSDDLSGPNHDLLTDLCMTSSLEEMQKKHQHACNEIQKRLNRLIVR